jgi:hypothetical protein
MSLPPEVHARLEKLLPRLAALTDKHRLKVLADIDRVLLNADLSWQEVAAALQPPPRYTDYKAAEVLATIDRIEAKRSAVLTENAKAFLEQVRMDAAGGGTVELSERQAQWLHQLRDRAEGLEVIASQARPALRLVTGRGDAA